jgi:hypothetical protein
MAGAGYKLFNVGDVLTAAQVNTYLQQQTVMAFANSAARTSALSAVLAEGMMSYLLDTNAVEVYNGSAWVSVGGSIPLTTKGDLLGYDTAVARIPIGTNNQVLTADSAQALGLKWATPSAPAYSGVSLYNSADIALASGTATALTFDTEYFDTDSFHSTSSNTSRITVPAGKGGKYLITYYVQFANNTTGTRNTSLRVNTTIVYQNNFSPPTSSTTATVNVGGAWVGSLAVSDYIELFCTQNSGGSLNIQGVPSYTLHFAATYLGA